MIADFYDSTVTITRPTTTTTTGSDSIVTVGSYLGVFRVEGEKDKLYVANNMGKEFDFYTDEASDIAVGDSMIFGTDTYSVLASSAFEDLLDDVDSHLKVRAVKR